MRIAENLEVRISSTGKTFQIVSTSGRRDYVVASIPRDIGDQLFSDSAYKTITEAYESLRDKLPTRETLRNAYVASKQEAEVYRNTPANMTATVSKTKAKGSNPVEVPAIKAMQARATERILNESNSKSEPIVIEAPKVDDKKARLKALLAIAKGKTVKTA